MLKRFPIIGLALLSCLMGCNGQKQNNEQRPANQTGRVGGDCEAGYCELMYLSMPKTISSVDTSAGWYEKGQKLIVTGTVFQIDGRTPAPNTIVYYHHTDNNGYYSPRNDNPVNQTRHGHLRGWVKTDENGQYAIYTIRPAPYPNQQLPAHIHLLVKEPNINNEYWIEDITFDDDPLLIPHLKKYPEGNRCGSGVVRILLKDSLQIAEHNIILGLNIPNYPKKTTASVQSGLNIGESQPSFSPFHAYGLDKGSQACPVCKYGRYHGILYFVSNHPNWGDIKQWLSFLEQESSKRQQYLKVYFVYGNEKSYSKQYRQDMLEKLGEKLHIKNLALTFVPSFTDTATNVHLSKIDAAVENTFIIYKHRTIVDKYIGLKPTSENFATIINTLDRTKGDYFNLAVPKHE